MRSQPYTPPPPLPPLLAELSAYLPNRDRDRTQSSDSGIALAALDRETSRLLPQQRHKPHRVRVQGRLAPVRSISVANLRAGSGSGTGYDEAVGGALVRRRSCGGGGVGAARRAGRDRNRDRSRGEDRRGSGQRQGQVSDDDEEVEEEEEDGEEESNERDAQLRGYGIGGRGNIRRPTDVMGAASSRTPLSLSSIFSGPSRSGPGPGVVDKKFSLAGLLNRIEERKGKER